MSEHVPWWRLAKKKPKQKTGRPKLFETAKARNHKDLDASLDAAFYRLTGHWSEDLGSEAKK